MSQNNPNKFQVFFIPQEYTQKYLATLDRKLRCKYQFHIHYKESTLLLIQISTENSYI